MVDVHARYIRQPRAGRRRSNRELEFLPDDEALDERKAAGGGLTAPEFAILLSYTKIALVRGAARLRPAGRPVPLERARALLPGAPAASGSRTQLQRHPLRREIIATRVDERPRQPRRDDLRLPPRRGDRRRRRPTSRAPTPSPARSSACAASGRRSRRSTGASPRETQIAMLLRARDPARARDALAPAQPPRPLDIAAAVARYAPGAAALAEALPTLLGPPSVEAARADGREFVAVGVPPELAAARRTPGVARPDARSRRGRSGGRVDVSTRPAVYFAIGDAARAALAARADRRPAAGGALGGDGARCAPGGRRTPSRPA